MRQLKITHSITNRDSYCLEKYLSEIAKETILTGAQEEDLARKIKTGDEVAMQKLIKCNLRFVVSVAKQYQHQGLSLPDLINEGNIGLIKAAQKFDSTKGFKFISYAVWWIRQTIMIALVDKVRLVRIPFNQVAQISRIKRAQIEFEQKNGREMNNTELCDSLQISLQTVKDVMSISAYPVSFDSPVSSEEGSDSLYEIFTDPSYLPADSELIQQSVKHDVKITLNQLKPREREVVKMYYGIEYDEHYSVEQIADRLELTRERVRQVKDKAIKKLQKVSSSGKLKMHLC
jgi:RNA polymerase primary sigma factor